MQEKRFQFEGLPVTYFQGGVGNPLLLIHGSGPGASSLGNWRPVLEVLAQRYQVFAMDLIGFGKSARKLQAPYFDYPLWVRQAEAMISIIGGERVGLIGHSLAGSICLRLAGLDPRVCGVLTTGTMGVMFDPTDVTRRSWQCPTTRQELLSTLAGLIHDMSVVDEAFLTTRESVVFQPGYADYFNQMFARDSVEYVREALLDQAALDLVKCRVMLLHGRNDRAISPLCSTTIGAQLLQADVLLLDRCSHSVVLERTRIFLAAADELFSTAVL